MSGYTPVFSSVFDGTLHGRWPHTGIWVCLLAMADKHGCIDKVPRAIAADIGCDLETLNECIADFCAPDPDSRSADSDGRRLELIDPARPWGWRIINHGKYRERARKQAWDAARTESGRDAERKRTERAKEGIVPTCPDVSRLSPLSNTNTNTNTNSDVQQLRSSSERSLRPSSSERARRTLSKSERNKRQLAELAAGTLKAMPK